jgi:hypothetical protein
MWMEDAPMLSDRDEAEEDGYRLQPEEGEVRGPAPSAASVASAAQLLRKAEANVAAEEEAERSSGDRIKENLGGWWQKAKGVAAGWGQGAKTLAEAGSRKAEAATIKTVSLPKAYAALGRAIYEDRRHPDEFPQAYTQLDVLTEQLKQLHTPDATAGASLLDRAKQSVRRAADAAADKALSVKFGQRLQRLGAECYARLGTECGPPHLTAAVHSLLTRLEELGETAE